MISTAPPVASTAWLGASLSIVAVVSLSSPASAQVVPPATADDPVARAMAQQALTAATSPVISKTTVVGGGQPNMPAATGASGTIGNSPIQAAGSSANDTGYLAFKFGNDAKGLTNYWVKTRGPTMNSYGAVQAADRIVVDLWQAGTGGQTGHAGGTQVIVDNGTFTAGEVAGRWSLFTGTGLSSGQATRQYPNRFGSIDAIVANSFQQVLFPGGTGSTPEAGPNFGGWVVIGAGASSPGFGPLKFLSAGATLLATPEGGAFEVDAGARPFFTTGDGVRRAIVLADTASPGVRVLAGAGSGAAGVVDGDGNAGMVTLTVGASPASSGGGLFTVTYAHPFPVASYPVVSPANAAAVALLRNTYLTATAAGFTVSLPAGSAASAGSVYAITFYAPGR